MDLKQAKENMYDGGVVTHEMFDPEDFLFINDFGEVITNEGYRYPLCELAADERYSYLNDGWSNWKE